MLNIFLGGWIESWQWWHLMSCHTRSPLQTHCSALLHTNIMVMMMMMMMIYSIYNGEVYVCLCVCLSVMKK